MAISADVLLAVTAETQEDPEHGEKEATVRISNVDHAKFESCEFDIPSNDDVPVDASSHQWSNYFKAGMRGALAWLRQRRSKVEDLVPASMDVLVDGSIPQGAGLSSSSAFVCASALAVLRANGERSVNKKDLVELAISSERLVGVNSGGYE